MIPTISGILIAVTSALVAIAGVTFDLRREGTSRLTRIGIAVLVGHVLVAGLAVLVITTELREVEAKRDRTRILDEWMKVPITDPTIGLEVNFETALNDVTRKEELLRPLLMEVSMDFGPLIALPQVHMSGYLLDKKGSFEVSRIHLREVFPNFPKTIGELVGHSLKFREHDIRPFTIIEGINLYYDAQATKPFLRLTVNSHERTGNYYMRVWYPDEVKRMPSLQEGLRNHGPFVFLAELLPEKSPLQ